MRQLFQQLALRQPVVLLEDWHWADRSSIELASIFATHRHHATSGFVTRPDPEGPAARIRQFASRIPAAFPKSPSAVGGTEHPWS
jgi:hypothetical protein